MDDEFKGQLRAMIDQLAGLIDLADAQCDYLLGAILCEARGLVERRYNERTGS